MTAIGWWAVSDGGYVLDSVIDRIKGQWREGRQIVILVGAGISVQSGFPALSQLGLHLLRLDALRSHKMYLPTADDDPPAPQEKEMAGVYSLLRDGWSSPFMFTEFYAVDQTKAVRRFLDHRLGGEMTTPGEWPIHKLKEFAEKSLGLNWFHLLDRVAGDDPRLIELLIDDIGTRVVPGAAHNLLSQLVSWFNVKLILTTNFDSLIEDSLRAEGQSPYIFDVHYSAPPPPRLLVRPHLAVLKLHGSHYGIRADRTIDTPLDPGHQHIIADYFDPDALLLILDYGGGDKRLMDLIRHLISPERLRNRQGSEVTNERTVVRIDGIATDSENNFHELGQKHPTRVWNVYYPHSRLFLLDALQKCSGKLPNTWKGYPAVPQTPAPFKTQYMFGCQPQYKGNEGKGLPERRLRTQAADDGLGKFQVVMGPEGSGVSQYLAQVAEDLYRSHQMLWCDVDEAASVGTLVSCLYSFAVSRQPELPNVPLPLDLPVFDAPAVSDDDLGFDSLLRTAEAIWNRLKRESYLVIIDSVSYGVLQLLRLAEKTVPEDARLVRKASRIILFIAMLSRCADIDTSGSQCVLLIGTHANGNDTDKKLMEKARSRCRLALGKANTSHPAAGGLDAFVDLLSDEHCSYPIQQKKHTLQPNGSLRGYRYPPDGPDPAESTKPWVQEKTFSSPQEAVERLGWLTQTEKPQLPLGRFLYEAALCNRPRSWCQLLALPVVEAHSRNFRRGGRGDRTRALTELVRLSIDWGFLRPQPGAFYYMDGTLRGLIRQTGGGWEYEGPDSGEKVTGSARVHEKMLRYYERAYNVSGDITALNYFYYHSQEFLTACETEKTGGETQGMEELARGLLENTKYARRHLNVYDHVFLLLRLRDLLERYVPSVSSKQMKIEAILDSLDATLRDIYDDAEDHRNGTQLLEARLLTKRPPPNPWRERQELHARAFDLCRSCIAGAFALLPGGLPEPLATIAGRKSGTADSRLPASAGDALKITCDALTKGVKVKNSSAWAPWQDWIRLDSARVEDALLSIIRLARSATRLGYYGGGAVPGGTPRVLLSAGKSLLAGISGQSGLDTKLFWARYHNASAYCSLYQINSVDALEDGFSHIYRATSLAKSYAIRAGGILGDGQRAIAAVNSAEALIWEGRLLTIGGSNAAQSAARQISAMGELSEARRLLTDSRLALAWWREITVLTCTVRNDVVKADMPLPSMSLDTTRLAEKAVHLRNLATDVCFLKAVIWNDPWREMRLAHQLLRTILYCGWVFATAYEEHRGLAPANRSTPQATGLIAVCSDVLSALRLIGGADKGVPVLPKYCNGEAVPGRVGEDWLRDLTSGITRLTIDLTKDLTVAGEKLGHCTGGVMKGAIEVLEEDAGALHGLLGLMRDGKIPAPVEWQTVCVSRPLHEERIGYAGL